MRLFFLLLACLAACLPAAAVELRELGKFTTRDGAHVPYRAIVTPGRRHDERVALVIFLHGDWQDGSNNESQLAGYGNGSLELVDAAKKAHLPLVYVAPQVERAYWPPKRVAAVVRDVLARFPVDAKRIYLTGISDGGTGVWDSLKAWPECFAAGVPMSGMTEIAGLASIRDVPEWIFHGAKDNDTDIEKGYNGAMVGSRAVVRALREMGGAPRYTEYPNEQHVIWQHAYATPGLLPWLLDQRLAGESCDFSHLPQTGATARLGAGAKSR